MDKFALINQAAEALSDRFELEELQGSLPSKGKDAYDTLKRSLADKIAILIDTDFQGLLQILYRIDVNEQKVRESLANNPLGQGPLVLADLIIERQLQKLNTREQYRNKDPDVLNDEERLE